MYRYHVAHRFRPTIEIVVASLIVLITFFHWISYLLSDYASAFSGHRAWWLLLGYQGVVATTLVTFVWFSHRLSNSNVEASARCLTSALENQRKFLPILMILCCVGLVLHGYSKLALVNFNIPACMQELRQTWISTPHDQIPVYRRVTSVLGHLLSGMAYAGMFFSVYRYSIGVRKMSSLAFAMAFFVAGVVYAGFIGSQNAMLGFLVMTVLAIGLGAVSVPKLQAGWFGGTMVVIAFTSLTAFSSVSVFNNRVECGDRAVQSTVVTFEKYEHGFLDEIPMAAKNETWLRSSVRGICPSCNAIFIYLNHGIYNLNEIFAQKEGTRGNPVFFAFFRGVAKRLGFPFEEPPLRKRVYGLGGATLPGSAYHDFGFLGVFLVGISQALLTIVASWLLRSGLLRWEGVGVVLYVVVGFVTALSMMFVGFNVITFPFVFISITVSMVGLIVWNSRAIARARSPSAETISPSTDDNNLKHEQEYLVSG